MIVQVAPVDKPMYQDDALAPGWLQFFSSTSAISGEWSREPWDLEVSGVTSTGGPNIVLGFTGLIVHFSIVWDNPVTFSSGTIEMPSFDGAQLVLEKSVLNVFDGYTLESGALIDDSSILLPDGTFNSCRIVGSAIIKE